MSELVSWTALPTCLSFGVAFFLSFHLPAQPLLPVDAGTTVNGFQDSFEGTGLGTNWVVYGADVYSVSGGALHVAPAEGGPNHLLCEAPGGSNTVQEVLAHIRIVDFDAGGAVFGGVGVAIDPGTGQGIDFLFHDNRSQGGTENYCAFLDDAYAWGPDLDMAWQMDQWYWVRLRQEPNAASQGGANDVFAKVWPGDGTVAEPADWQAAWDYTPAYPTRAGFAGITASISGSLSQFDLDYVLIKAAGLPAIQVAPNLSNTVVVTATPFPPPATAIPSLRSIEVRFNQGVTGITASDLLLNNVPATNVTAYSPSLYVFDFPQPPMGPVLASWAASQNVRGLSSGANVLLEGGWTYTLNRLATPASLEISEFMAVNQATLPDEDGDYSPWLELFNGTSNAVNLARWSLTTEPTNLAQWSFPNYVMEPGDYLVVFASGKNRTLVTGQLHTNFKLPAAGGFLALADPQTNLVSRFAPYPPQQPDVSYGRDPVLLDSVGPFFSATPGKPNATIGPGFAPEPQFSQAGGTFVSPFQLSLSAADPEVVVRYTMDGTMPTDVSPVYSGPITIGACTQVRARAFGPTLMPGPIHSESYIQITPEVAELASDLPAVILYNFGAGAVPIIEGSPYQFANLSFYEPVNGLTFLTNAPTLSTRTGIRVRGQSTRYFAKHAFAVKFWDDLNNATDGSPLALPPGKDWALYAPDVYEPVLIHNPLIFQLSNDLGRYAPRTRFLEVYINTEGGPVTKSNYNGIYVLMEKIKRATDRVDVDELAPDDNTPPAVTGGYMLSIDKLAPGQICLSAAGQTIGYRDPKQADILTPERVPQQQYIQNYLNTFYAALNGPNYTNPSVGYAAYIDVDSWIDHHLLNTLAFNVDMLVFSEYFHKPRLGKIVFGPLWDFDRSQGSADGRDFSPLYWDTPLSLGGGGAFSATWWSRLFTDIDFWQRWIDRYEDLRTGLLSTNHIYAVIDSLVAQVRREEPREIARWPGFTTPRSGVIGMSGYTNDFPGTYQGEVDFLKRWYRDRLHFIDTNFLARPVFSPNGGPLTPGLSLGLSGPSGAAIYYCTDGSDPRLPGGGVSATALKYVSPVAVSTNCVVAARAYNPAHHNLTGPNNPPRSSPWSGCATATFGIVTSPALVAYTNDGAVYAQDFDSLPNPGPWSVDAANPVTINGVLYTLDNPFGLALPVVGPGCLGGLGLTNAMCGWYGLGSLASKAGAHAGDQSTGGVISFGLTNSTAAGANRALGLLATSSTGPTAFGLQLVNATGHALGRMNLSYTGELWRQSAVAKRLEFSYYIDPSATNAFSATNVTAFLPGLDVAFPADAAATTPVAVDGTAAANQLSLGVTDQAVTNWPPGGGMWLVWRMNDAGGKGQGLAIDNLTFSASTDRPVLAIQTLGSQVVLTWSDGVLQSAANANGPFTTLTGIVSPWTNTPAGSSRFFRVALP